MLAQTLVVSEAAGSCVLLNSLDEPLGLTSVPCRGNATLRCRSPHTLSAVALGVRAVSKRGERSGSEFRNPSVRERRSSFRHMTYNDVHMTSWFKDKRHVRATWMSWDHMRWHVCCMTPTSSASCLPREVGGTMMETGLEATQTNRAGGRRGDEDHQ